MLFSGVRSSCDIFARNSDLYLEVSASSLAFSSSARAGLLDFLVLALHFGILFRKLLGFLGKLFVLLLQFLLLALQLRGELLGLLQQAFRLHGGLDAVQHDADAGRQLFKERQVRGGKGAERGQLNDRLHLVLKEYRKHHDVARAEPQTGPSGWERRSRDVGNQDALLFDGALAHQAFANPQALVSVAIPDCSPESPWCPSVSRQQV